MNCVSTIVRTPLAMINNWEERVSAALMDTYYDECTHTYTHICTYIICAYQQDGKSFVRWKLDTSCLKESTHPIFLGYCRYKTWRKVNGKSYIMLQSTHTWDKERKQFRLRHETTDFKSGWKRLIKQKWESLLHCHTTVQTYFNYELPSNKKERLIYSTLAIYVIGMYL